MEELDNILKNTKCPDGHRSHHHNCPTCNGTNKYFHEVWVTCLCECHQSSRIQQILYFIDTGGIVYHMKGCKQLECMGYVFSVDVGRLLLILWRLGGYVSFWDQKLGCIIKIGLEPSRGKGSTPLDALAAALWEALKNRIGG